MGRLLQNSGESFSTVSITSLPATPASLYLVSESLKPRTTQGDLSDLEWEMEKARLLQLSADRNREYFSQRETNVYEAGITPIERLWRLLVLALKPTATKKQLDWVSRWEDWSHSNVRPIGFDTRSAQDKFLAHTSYRRLGLFPDTPEALEFEANFDNEFKSSPEFEEAQEDKMKIGWKNLKSSLA